MRQLTIEEMQAMIQEFCDERDWEQFHNPKDLAIGMSTEANELLDLFRFKNEMESKEIVKLRHNEVAEELMDVLYFALRFAQMNQIDITSEFRKKMTKNEAKYPKDIVRGKNAKYNEYE